MPYRRLQHGPRLVLCLMVLMLALPALGGDASWTVDDLVGTNEVAITIDVTCTGDPTACAIAGLSTPYSSMRTTGVSGSGTAGLLEGGSFEFDLDKMLTTPMVDAWTAELDDVTFDALGNLGIPTLTDTFIFGQTGGPIPVPGLTFGAFGPQAMTETQLNLGLVVSTTGLVQNLTDQVVGPALEAVNGDFEMLDDTQFEVQNLQFGETGITSHDSGNATLNFTFTVDATMNLSGQLTQADDANLVSAAVCGGTTHYAWVRDPDGPNPNIAYRNCDISGGTCNPTQVLVSASTAESAPSLDCEENIGGDTVAVAWEDTRNGNSDIAFRKSEDGGTTFSALAFLAQGPADETNPAVFVSGLNVHAVWEDRRRGNVDVAYRKSTNRGDDFGSFGFLVRSDFDDTDPVIAADEDLVLLAWVDRRYGNQDIAYRRSDTLGATWQSLHFLVRAPTAEQSPSVSVSGTVMMIAWSDLRFGNQDLAYRRSTNGVIFAGLTFLVRAPTDDTQPSIRNDGDDALLTWVDQRSGNKNISYRHSSTGGASFGSTARLVAAATDEFDPACDVTGNDAACAWADTRTGSPNPHARESDDGGQNWFTMLVLD